MNYSRPNVLLKEHLNRQECLPIIRCAFCSGTILCNSFWQWSDVEACYAQLWGFDLKYSSLSFMTTSLVFMIGCDSLATNLWLGVTPRLLFMIGCDSLATVYDWAWLIGYCLRLGATLAIIHDWITQIEALNCRFQGQVVHNIEVFCFYASVIEMRHWSLAHSLKSCSSNSHSSKWTTIAITQPLSNLSPIIHNIHQMNFCPLFDVSCASFPLHQPYIYSPTSSKRGGNNTLNNLLTPIGWLKHCNFYPSLPTINWGCAYI